MSKIGRQVRKNNQKEETLKEDFYIVAIHLANLSNAGFFSTEYKLSYSRQVLFGKGDRSVRLKDLCGLTFAEINKIVPFDSLKQGSLGNLYMDAKIRLKKMTKKSKEVMHRSNFS